MAITIASNIASMAAQSQLSRNQEALGSTSERLSSGMRINRASDDAAGLAISDSLRADSRVFGVAVRNVNDGISAISIADGVLQSFADITIRIRELAQQAANGTYSFTQRRSLNSEANALVLEWNRLTQTTRFNGVNLLDGSAGTLSIQAGYGSNGSLTVGIGNKLARTVGDGTFNADVTYVNGTSPENIRAYDLNGDGKQDLVSTSYSNQCIMVQLGNGDGTFKAMVSYQAGGNANGMTVGDFNNDGQLDVAAGLFGAAGNISVFLGNSDGSFKAALSYGGGTNNTNMEAADLNGDGILDLATTGFTDGGFYVLIGNSDGSFRAKSLVTVGQTSTVTFGDFDNDGYLDAVSNSNTSAVILLGNGNGTFRAGTSFFGANLAGGAGVNGAKAADMNGDGYLDIVVTGSDSTIDVLLGNGNGSFKAALSYVTGNQATPLSVMNLKLQDLNGDGYFDVISSSKNSGTLEILMGNSDGSLQAKTSYASGNRPNDEAIADFNGDGALDIALVSENDNKTNVFIANARTITALPRLDLFTQGNARGVMAIMDSALTRVSAERGNLGAHQSRFTVALNTLFSQRLEYDSARSRISDADVAIESANFVKSKILTQVGASILTQANTVPAIALKLLGG